jgi:hypothetical protein
MSFIVVKKRYDVWDLKYFNLFKILFGYSFFRIENIT